MKEYVKAYNMFLPGRYMKYILYLFMPVLVIGFCLICNAFLPLSDSVVIMLLALYVFWVEIMLDTWVLRGIAKKKNNNLEYLITSAKWKKLIKKVMVFDIVRRFLSVTIMTLLFFFLMQIQGENGEGSVTIPSVIAMILSICLWVTLLCGITRNTENIYVTMMVVYVAFIPFFMILPLTMEYMGNVIGICILAVLFVAVAVFNIFHIIKKIGGSFYDE